MIITLRLSSGFPLHSARLHYYQKARFFNTLNNYLTWCAVRRYINYASKPFRKVYDDFVKSLSGGKTSDRRWKSCVMTTNTAFGLALTKPFIMKTQIEIEDLNKGPIIIFFSLMAHNLRQDINRGSSVRW